jgi:hypothetical protein
LCRKYRLFCCERSALALEERSRERAAAGSAVCNNQLSRLTTHANTNLIYNTEYSAAIKQLFMDYG